MQLCNLMSPTYWLASEGGRAADTTKKNIANSKEQIILAEITGREQNICNRFA